MSDARRAGIVAVIVLLAGAALLHASRMGSVRLAGVGLVWWHGALVAPLLAGVVTSLVFLCDRGAQRAGVSAIAPWLGPAMVTTITARAFAGAGAPVLALAVCGAPLLALLGGPSSPRDDDAGPVPSVLVALAIGLVLWAQFIALADLGRVLGAARWQTLVVVAALALAATLPARTGWARRAVLVSATAALLAPLVFVGALLGIPPWSAWRAIAAQPALAFVEGASRMPGDVTVLVPTTLVFSEPHRVQALRPGVVRVVERDSVPPVVREWRLGAGESLTLRPGDELAADPGVRLRFEAGRRVPGVPPSGAAWADLGESGAEALLAVGGLMLTLAGGALALGPRAGGKAGGREVVAATSLAVVVPVALVAWGVYAAWKGADLALGAPPAAPFARLPLLAVRRPWNVLLAGAAVVGVIGLFGALAAALRARFNELVVPWMGEEPRGPGRARDLWAVMVAAAATGAVVPFSAWWALLLGSGLAASVWAASVADDRPSARLAGTLGGVGAFVALLLGGMAPERATLVAVPLAGVVARVAARARG